ncbi:hypothetical protein CFP56_007503 [Quercus suber]|uniref:Uncharacterized protein n=1 Tax=Quercus suber TaxID=58331 RepID=A0AAW0L541_QUESU
MTSLTVTHPHRKIAIAVDLSDENKNIIIGDEVELHPVPEAEEEDNDHDYHDAPDDHPKGHWIYVVEHNWKMWRQQLFTVCCESDFLTD